MKALPKRKGNWSRSSQTGGRVFRLNESPSEKEGKSIRFQNARLIASTGLNESPSEKEGKFHNLLCHVHSIQPASMKALPKRKGNGRLLTLQHHIDPASMKALPKRKGNLKLSHDASDDKGLNESPSEKEGK